MLDRKITAQTVTRSEFEYILRAANATIGDFMSYDYDPNKKFNSYRKIAHIKVIRSMLNTDLKTAKDAADIAQRLWKNEYVTEDDSLDRLREKLVGVSSVTEDTPWALDNDLPF